MKTLSWPLLTIRYLAVPKLTSKALNGLSALFKAMAVDEGVTTAKAPVPPSDTVSEAPKSKIPANFKIPRTASLPSEVCPFYRSIFVVF